MPKIKKQFKISGMHCSSCAMMIEGELEDIGVEAKVSFASSVLEVEYESDKIGDKQMVQAVEKAGYKVA